MKRATLAWVLVGAAALTPRAEAAIGTIDAVPAATLLLPFFEVDIQNVDCITTLFSINNASATAVLAHVTVWSDQSIPVLDFDVYLTGYDVATIDLRDIFANRTLPLTASDGQDPGDSPDPNDGISNQGVISQDINFASCVDLPYTPGAGITAGFQAHLQAVLQGLPSPSTGSCYGSKQPDTGFLRGYVTIDTVNACNLFFPSDWAFYAPFVTDQNVLWGDWFLVDPLQGSAVGSPLVHIESAGGPAYGGAPNAPFAPGDHTFYGRYNGATADDQREPLPTTLAMRYLAGGEFDGGTDFIIWREADESDTPYNCNLQGPPSWYPLEATQIVMFDEAENPVTSESCRSGDPTCQQEVVIPNEAQRVDPAVDLLSPFPFGWAWLNLQHAEVTPIYGDTAAQAWGTTVMEALGRFSVGLDAIQLDNANTPNVTLLPVP